MPSAATRRRERNPAGGEGSGNVGFLQEEGRAVSPCPGYGPCDSRRERGERRSRTRRPSGSHHRARTAPAAVSMQGSQQQQAGKRLCGPSSAVLALNVLHGREIKTGLEDSRRERRRQAFLLQSGHFGLDVLQSYCHGGPECFPHVDL